MGNKRKYHIPDQQPVSAETTLAKEKWKKVSWRRGTKGRLTCLFAARRVRVADGHRHRMLDNRVQAMPGDEVWLVGERRLTGEQNTTSQIYLPMPPSTCSPRQSRRQDRKRRGEGNRLAVG